MIKRNLYTAPVLALLALVACDKQNSSTTTTSAEQKPITQTTSTIAPPEAKPTAAPDKPMALAGAPVVTFKDGLATPESVLYDDKDDNYIVSNINGSPSAADGNGYLSRLSPDGKVVTQKWIEGGKNKAVLNAPKGMALVADTLYVADLDTVRMFDRKTGAPVGEVKVPGATFLNDIAPMGDKVVVSDTGVKMSAKGSEPTGTDAIYTIDKAKKLTTVAKSKDLGGPNGLAVIGDRIWTVSMGTGELYSLDSAGKRTDVQKMPKGTNDGLVVLPGGDLLVSSWDSQMVYRGKPGAEMKPLIEDVKSPADIGYDTKRNRVLVPLFEVNEVRGYDLK